RGRYSNTAATSSTRSSPASVESDLQVVVDEGHNRHVGGARMAVERLRAMNALDESVNVEQAVDTLAAITDVQFAFLLRDRYGWSLDRIESWIADTSRALLLRPALQ
ncbi:MAG: hypothetical protein ABI894_18200, partial [Ilumatobacteraceae bacterium]